MEEKRVVYVISVPEADRWVYRAAMEGDRELKKRVSDLEEWIAGIEPEIEFYRDLIATLTKQIWR